MRGLGLVGFRILGLSCFRGASGFRGEDLGFRRRFSVLVGLGLEGFVAPGIPRFSAFESVLRI